MPDSLSTHTPDGIDPTHLKEVLAGLIKNPYPSIPSPPDCKRRAAVALLIRIRPTYPDIPQPSSASKSSDPSNVLDSFFGQGWVQRGEPEILFIKRAARTGDRYTSHVALPGGKRDPDDANDEATAVRETVEEVGLDLRSSCIVPIGPLPERVVTTEWGTVPLMVLCPYVFLVTGFALPPLRLQPAEISSVHWVPVRALIDPALRTTERADVADRLARRHGLAMKYVLRAFLGKMLYAGILLLPSESIYGPAQGRSSQLARARQQTLGLDTSFSSMFQDKTIERSYPERRLVLWGLTHGIIGDLLGLLPRQQPLRWWLWPTLSAPDVRLAVWLYGYHFRQSKYKVLSQQPIGQYPLVRKKARREGHDVRARGGTDEACRNSSVKLLQEDDFQVSSSATTYLLDGYYGILKRATFTAVFARTLVILTVITWVFWKKIEAPI